jgi:hypothetical protein
MAPCRRWRSKNMEICTMGITIFIYRLVQISSFSTLDGQINKPFDKGGTNKQFEFDQSKQPAIKLLLWRWLHHLKIINKTGSSNLGNFLMAN